MPIKVVDLNGEAKEELPAIEEAPEEVSEETTNEVVEEVKDASAETGRSPLNAFQAETSRGSAKLRDEVVEEVVEEVKEEVVEVAKEEPKIKAKPKPKASDIVPCPDCNKNMTYKNLRYSHKCSPEPPPVKKQSNPKGKAKPKAKAPPKPPPEVYYTDSEESEEEEQQQYVRKKQLAPKAKQPSISPATALAQHYQLLQQQMIKQKQEKYNNLCQSIFSSRGKRR